MNRGYQHRYQRDGWRKDRGPFVDSPVATHIPGSFTDKVVAESYWWTMVEAFTHRDLSVLSDRPLAISDIAERLWDGMTERFTSTSKVQIFLRIHWIHRRTLEQFSTLDP